MAQLELRDISYRYPEAGVHGISFSVDSGAVAALVGASGSGKTTILKLIAGFLAPLGGEITVAGTSVAKHTSLLPPHKRNVGLVFQQHALLPHLTIEKNIAFARKDARVASLLADFRIGHLAQRYPHEISGGEAQRVALARAIAAQPAVLLMDEPFSSIDSVLRRELRQECMAVLRRAGITCLIVTHDAEEAMELADQLIVLGGGSVSQIGSPHEVYYHPVNPEVAALFGEINPISDPALILALTGQSKPSLLLRPETLEIVESGGIPATITHIYYRGNYEILTVLLEQGAVLKIHTHHHHHRIGQRVMIRCVDGAITG